MKKETKPDVIADDLACAKVKLKETKKETTILKSENEHLTKFLIQHLEESGKSNGSLVVSIISLSVNMLCWAVCFYLLFQQGNAFEFQSDLSAHKVERTIFADTRN